MRSPQVAPAILSQFANYNQENLGFAIDALLKDAGRMSILLDAVEAGRVKPGDLGATRIEKLTRSADATVRVRARKLFAAAGR